MKRERIDNVLSGRASDLSSRLARTGLQCLEPIYWSIAQLRNRSWDRRSEQVARIDVPVISIGNLTTGGTGKTPMVRWTVERLLGFGEYPSIVSRGYGGKPGEPNDEFRELELFLPETPHVQNPDRVAAAGLARDQHQASVIVLDDGFQHRRIGRDLDIVLIDATCPFGYDHLLPRGLLREPVTSLNRADAVVITRVDQVSDSSLIEIQSRIQRFVDPKKIAAVTFPATRWIDRDGQTAASFEPDQPLVGFCGIGNPQGFRKTLEQLCPRLQKLVTFADHHDYRPADCDTLQQIAVKENSPVLICTVKDLVKIRRLPAGRIPVVALSIGIQFESGQNMLEQLIQQSIGKMTPGGNPS